MMKQKQKAAIIEPLRTESGENAERTAEAKKAMIKFLINHTDTICELAKEYSRTDDDQTRNRLNKENLHLHTHITVFWNTFSSEEQKTLKKLQEKANNAIEKAAKKTHKTVTYVTIEDIRSSDGKSAGEHLYERLIHPSINNVDDFIASVEEDVLRQMVERGYDREAFHRLFSTYEIFFMHLKMKNNMHQEAGNSEHHGSETPAIQIYGSHAPDVPLLTHDPASVEKYNQTIRDKSLEILVKRVLDEKSSEAAREIYKRCTDEATKAFSEEPTVLRIHAGKAIIIGDLHGDLETFSKILRNYPPKDYKYICMGDIVDRGENSTELLAVLLANKVMHPKSFFMLRGNHESSIGTLSPQQFPGEFMKKLNDEKTLHKLYDEVFAEMPIAMVLNDRYFIAHGGIPTNAPRIADIEALKKVKDPSSNKKILQMLWNDPSASNGSKRSNRGDGVYEFGHDIAENFLKKNSLEMIIRGHKHGKGGYIREGKVITLLTTKAYHNDGQYIARVKGNKLRIMDVSGPKPHKVRTPPNPTS